MHPLNMTKLAYGCDDAEILGQRLSSRAMAGETNITTRYRPTRHEELVGGSLYWIIRHSLVARSRIVGFDTVEGRCLIRLDATLVPVRARPKRAHQGWRYLVATDAPPDFDGAPDELGEMPPHLIGELAALALI